MGRREYMFTELSTNAFGKWNEKGVARFVSNYWIWEWHAWNRASTLRRCIRSQYHAGHACLLRSKVEFSVVVGVSEDFIARVTHACTEDWSLFVTTLGACLFIFFDVLVSWSSLLQVRSYFEEQCKSTRCLNILAYIQQKPWLLNKSCSPLQFGRRIVPSHLPTRIQRSCWRRFRCDTCRQE
jgi:hypothetical protein